MEVPTNKLKQVEASPCRYVNKGREWSKKIGEFTGGLFSLGAAKSDSDEDDEYYSEVKTHKMAKIESCSESSSPSNTVSSTFSNNNAIYFAQSASLKPNE